MPVYGGVKKRIVSNHKRYDLQNYFRTKTEAKKYSSQIKQEGFITTIKPHKVTRGTEKGKTLYVLYKRLDPNGWRAKLRKR